MTAEDYQKDLLPILPQEPGVYQFHDEKGVILYVGKAKNLKSRVSSYFSTSKEMLYKTRALVKKADHVTFTIVETEHDALLLENVLIKKNQPRYNVMLKDAKSYPYICIKKERFPRVFFTRRLIKDGSNYYGPYPSVHKVMIILDVIKNLFQLRTCPLMLSRENVDNGKFKVCLEYHIKNCAGPCCNFETEEAYNEKIVQIQNMLKGNFVAVKQHLKNEINAASESLEYEKAHLLNTKLKAFDDYQSKSTVASTSIADVDVFSIISNEKMAYVNYLKVVNGAIIHTYNLEMTKNMDEDEAYLLAYGVSYLQEKFVSFTKEIILPQEILLIDDSLEITVPKIGDKKKLLELSERNVKYYMMQQQKDAATNSKRVTSTERILKTLQHDLQMEEVPFHIECFDNSNLQGTNPVSSCVVFKNAKPAKRDYRHFNIKTVEGPNDFASMEEVVYRRYHRLLSESTPLPQLVIIDGGKGQLSAAMKSIALLGLEGKITVVGIAKKLEEIYFPNDSLPIYIDKKSESLKLIQQARNEAHRFGITFHRNQRSKNFIKSELTDIAGVGEKKLELLLAHFKSVKNIRNAAIEDIASIVGNQVAQNIIQYFKENIIE
jgi:excinuclease ABC subunit C